MTTSPLKALGAALLLVLPAVAVAQPPKDRSARVEPNPVSPYGRWDKGWGSRPPTPPKHWTNKGDWYRHVRACQQKFRSYNARTDTYRTATGKARRCPV